MPEMVETSCVDEVVSRKGVVPARDRIQRSSLVVARGERDMMRKGSMLSGMKARNEL
jgi:hypothetical protein